MVQDSKVFLVSWIIPTEPDMEIDSPLEAARWARRVQLDPTSIATIFEVTDEQGVVHQIDLMEYP